MVVYVYCLIVTTYLFSPMLNYELGNITWLCGSAGRDSVNGDWPCQLEMVNFDPLQN